MLSPGTRLGGYVIGSTLGAGGMGEVYRARDTEARVATSRIKVLPDALRRRSPIGSRASSAKPKRSRR